MARKMTKKRNSGKTRRQMKRRREQLTTLAVCAFLFLCVGSFVTVGMINARDAKKPAEQWYVEDGDVEILAAPMAMTLDSGMGSTLNTGVQSESPVLPFFENAATPVPTREPRATMVPLPTPEPAPTMDVLEPEVTLEPQPVSLTITAVGDCTLGGNVPNGRDEYFDKFVRENGYDYFFKNVRDLFESDDLTIVNLEGPLTTSNDRRHGRGFNFRGKPEYVNILTGSSVELANVANNHAYDFGKKGFEETLSVLRNAGVGACGFGEMYMEEIKGVKVCSLGFTKWEYTQEQIVHAIELARPYCDLLIVNVHWGREGHHEADSDQKRVGKAMIDAGADLVIGTHPHVYGGVELYKGKYIVYSLGNFCFGGNSNPSDKNCTIFQQTFVMDVDGSISDGGINIIPARVSGSDSKNDFQPYMLSGEKGNKLVNMIAKVSNVDADRMVWMQDSYQVQSGMVKLSN